MMDKEVVTFSDIDIENCKFHHSKPSFVRRSQIFKKMQVSSMVSSGNKNYKYFIGYKDDDHKIQPLGLMLK